MVRQINITSDHQGIKTDASFFEKIAIKEIAVTSW